MKLLLILAIFGSNLFSGSLQPVNSYQETPEDYVLDCGDNVLVDIYGVSQRQITQIINSRGQITIEMCGPISLMGKTIPEATKAIQKGIAAHYAGADVTLSLLEPRKISVTVLGEVDAPGEHFVHGYSNLLRALQESGGITEVGSFRQIVFEPKDQPTRMIDLYDYLQGNLNMDSLRVQNGDAIRVLPYQRLVTIEGLVKCPATYELLENENIQDLVAYANGFVEDDIEIRVQHRSAVARYVEIVSMDSLTYYVPQDGDVINIVKVPDKVKDVAFIVGNVAHEGNYRVGKKVKTLKALLQLAIPQVGEKPNAVVVYRDTTLVQIGDNDIALIGGEKVYVVYNQVHVEGAVYAPTSVDYEPSYTVKDYILKAGEFTRKAARNHIYIVEPDGRHVTNINEARIIPGCKIVVPNK